MPRRSIIPDEETPEVTDTQFETPMPDDTAAFEPNGDGPAPATIQSSTVSLPPPVAKNRRARTRKQDVKLVRSWNLWDDVRQTYIGSYLDINEAKQAKSDYYAQVVAAEEAANPTPAPEAPPAE